MDGGEELRPRPLGTNIIPGGKACATVGGPAAGAGACA